MNRATCQLPNQPCFHRAKVQLSPVGLFSGTRNVFQNPMELGGRKVRINHQTGFDQFFAGLTFHQPVYYLASEDIFSIGWISRLLEWAVAPIPIKKQTTDLQAVKNCIRVAREGGSIFIAPEGQRTFHGKTVYIAPSIAHLAKKLGLPIAIMRIEGGYGIQPRWSDVVRKGRMRSYVKRVIEPDEYKELTNDQLFAILLEELTVDESGSCGEFPHKKSAEYLERVVYTCPDCGLTTWESNGQVTRCTKCGRQDRYLPDKALVGVDRPFPYPFLADWYQAQEAFLNALDTLTMTDSPVWEETARLSLVHPGSHKDILAKNAGICLYGDRITIADRIFAFSEIRAVTILGKNKLNVYTDDSIFQIKGGKRFNGLKYLNFDHRYINLTTGDHNGKYLGL